MKTVKLQNEEYFTYNMQSNDLESAGYLTGDFVLASHINCENFSIVICLDTNENFIVLR